MSAVSNDLQPRVALVVLPHVMDCLSVGGVSACSVASPLWRSGITRSMATKALLRDFGHEVGTWLGRLAPPQRLAAVRWLTDARQEAPQVYTCPLQRAHGAGFSLAEISGVSSTSSAGNSRQASGASEVEEDSSLCREGHTVVSLPRFTWAHSNADDDVLGKMIMFGGAEGALPPHGKSGILLTVRGGLHGVGTCRLRGTWERLAVDPAAAEPSPRLGHGAIWLHDLSAMAVFGGRRGDNSQTKMSDLWVLEGRDPQSHFFEWHWAQVKPETKTATAATTEVLEQQGEGDAASSSASVPEARCHFASCPLTGRSFFLHGGHSNNGVLNDCWVCWIDDGFADLDEFQDSADPMPSRQASACMPLSRQVSEQLAKQVSDSYRRIAPQVSVSSNGSGSWAPAVMEESVGPVAVWTRVVADGCPPPRCCGHAAVRCGDSIILSGGWSGRTISHSISPVFVLQGVANPQTAGRLGQPGRRPVFSEVVLPSHSVCRPFGTFHSIGGRQTVAIGGWSDGSGDSKDSEPPRGGVQRTWHAACNLPMIEGCGPLVAVHGGQDESGSTRGDLLLLHWPVL